MKTTYQNETRDLCWKLFKETGEVSYYMLYKALENEENLD